MTAPSLDQVEEVPLTTAQRAMWFVQQLDPESAAYNSLFSARVRAPLELPRLEQAARALAARHELLRASFHASNGEPVMRIHAAAGPEVRHREVSAGEPSVYELARAEIARPFDLTRAPAWRIAVLSSAPDDHLLVLSIHHLIIDLATIEPLVDELLALYRDPGAALPALRGRFADFVHAERALLASPAGTELRSQWRAALGTDPPALDMPLDFPRPAKQTYDGSSVPVALGEGLKSRVRAFATELGVTPLSVLLAAYQALLGRWCGQRSFVVGTPMPGTRDMPELRGVIGFFVNTLPLRADLEGDPSFAELVRRVGATVQAARGAQALPLPVIVQDVVRHRDASRAPLFQTLFALQRTPRPGFGAFFVQTGRPVHITWHGFPLEPSGVSQSEGQFELALELTELGDDYAGELKFNTALLAEPTAQALAASYAALLDGGLQQPAQPMSRLPLLSERARADVLAASAGPASTVPEGDEPAGFVVDFLAQLERDPDATAVAQDGESWSYAALATRALDIAAELRDRGLPRGGVVGLELPRGPQWLAAMVGVLLAGGAYLALDPEHPPRRRAELLREAGAAGIVAAAARRAANDELAAALAAAGASPWRLELDAAPAVAASPASLLARARALPLPRASDLAYVVFTSGSTGTPKGALVEHAGMHNHLRAKQAELALGPGDLVAQTAPPSFVIANWQALAALEVGAGIEIVEREVASDPSALLRRVAGVGVTVLQVVPSMLRAILEVIEGLPASARPGLAQLRYLVPTGEALPLELCRRWFALYPEIPLVNAYGCSETSDDVAHHRVVLEGPGRDTSIVAPLGHPAGGVRLYLLDEHLEPVPDGAVGDLWVSGVAVGRGYINDAARTAEVFRTDPFTATPRRMYRTGDRARRRPDGALEYRGRRDHQVKVRGVRVELGEIEAVLRAHAGVRQAAVTAEADGHGDTRLVAHVALAAPPAEADAAGARAALQRHMQATLPAALVPSRYRFLDELPVNAHGKLDRLALARAAAEPAGASAPPPAAAAASAEAQAPGARSSDGGVRAGVRELWRGVLGVATLGDDDDFFALGGHSLLAVRLLVRAREQFGVELPLSSIFELSTVAQMADAIERAAPAGGGAGSGAASAEAASGAATTTASADDFRADPEAALAPFPLTDLQQAYWYGQTDDQGGGPAVAFLEHDLVDVAPAAFARAFDKLVARHPMLRAVIHLDGTQQVLAEPGPFPLEVVELEGRPEAEVEQALADSRAALSNFTVEPERWPMLRLRLHRLDARRVRLHLGFPLVIGDLQSFRVISRELGELLFHPDRELPPLGVTYRDCVLHARAGATRPEVQRAEAYWRARLDDLPGAPDLPLAPVAPPPGSPLRRFAGTLPAAQWQRVRARAQSLGLTPTALIATVYAEVLARFAAAPRFTLNLLVQRRPAVHPQIDDIVGNFSSTTLLAVDLREPRTFEERVRAVQTQLWNDLEHGQVSGIHVVRELARVRRDGRASAMPVVLASTLHLEADELDRHDLLGPPLSTALRTPHVWIDHQVAQTREGMRYHWDLLEARFPEGLGAAMFACYEAALRRLADDDAAWRAPGSLVRLPAAQLAARERANATEAAVPDALLHAPVFARARAQPDAVAVISAERVLRYGELAARAAALAHELRAAGVLPGEPVAVVMHKGWQQVVAVLGALAAGAAYLPIDAALPAARRAQLLALARARLVLTQPALADGPDWPAELRVIAVGDQAPDRAPAEPAPVARPTDLAYVIFTSGSTGEPKGVMIDHRGAVNTVHDINQRFAIGPADRVLGVSSLSFDLSVYDVFGVLGAGGALVLPAAARALEPDHWLQLVTAHGVTLWNSVPQLLQLLVEHAELVGAELAPLRLALVSGDWVPLELAPRLAERAPRAHTVSLGGATEASIWSIAHPIEAIDPAWASIPYGQPLANQRLHVLDDQLEPRPVWVSGELYIAGIGLARGYWGDAAKTAERFFAHPRTGERLYRTGDLGRYLPSGEIEFLGRVDAQVKINGYRVELGEIEAHLSRLPGVRAAAVAAVGPARGPRRLVAYLVEDADPAPAPGPGRARPLDAGRATELRAELAQHLPEYMVPAAYAAIDRLPLTGNGKLDRQALQAVELATDLGGEHSRAASVPPRDELERALAAVWREVLGPAGEGAPALGIHDDFFAVLGGNSFAVVRMLARVSAAHGPSLSLGQFTRTPTIAALADAIRARLRGAGDAATPAWTPRVELGAGAEPALFLVHPIGGGVLCYRGLAAALAGRAVIGLQARGLEGDAPSSSIAEMAEAFARAVAERAPHGPVFLGGWSMGGLVAHELARLLEARGRQVAGLVLLDPAPAGERAHVPEVELRRWFVRDLVRSGDPGGAPPALHGASLPELLAEAQAQGLLPRTLALAELSSLFAVFAAHQAAMERHRPGAVRAPALLVAAGESDPASCDPWRARVGAVEALTVPGDHYSMLEEARLPALAEAVRRFLAAHEVRA